jgi:hypothetical protein
LALTLPTEHKNITFPFPIYILNNKTQLIFKNYLNKLLTINSYKNLALKKNTSKLSIFKFQKFNSFLFKNKTLQFHLAPKVITKKKYNYFTQLTYKKTKNLKLKKKKPFFTKIFPPKLKLLKNENKNNLKNITQIKRYTYFLILNKLTKRKQLKLYKKNFFIFSKKEDVFLPRRKRLKNKYNTYYNNFLNKKKQKVITFFKQKYHFYYKNYISYLEGLHLGIKKKQKDF